MTLFDLSPRVVAVTGGYGHLGRDMCLSLAAQGASVEVLARSAEKFAAAFAGTPHADRIRLAPADIADGDSLKAALADIARRHGGLDALINNAVFLRGSGDPLALSDEDWKTSLDGALASVYRGIREAVPHLRRRGGGSIVNVASMYGMVSPDFSAYRDAPAFLNPPHYGAAKAAVLQLTRYFAKYLGGDAIRVNAISPGPFPSPSVQRDTAFVGELSRRTALQRIGQPRELGGAAVFLCSDAASFVTGHNLVVDGGWTIS